LERDRITGRPGGRHLLVVRLPGLSCMPDYPPQNFLNKQRVVLHARKDYRGSVSLGGSARRKKLATMFMENLQIRRTIWYSVHPRVISRKPLKSWSALRIAWIFLACWSTAWGSISLVCLELLPSRLQIDLLCSSAWSFSELPNAGVEFCGGLLGGLSIQTQPVVPDSLGPAQVWTMLNSSANILHFSVTNYYWFTLSITKYSTSTTSTFRVQHVHTMTVLFNSWIDLYIFRDSCYKWCYTCEILIKTLNITVCCRETKDSS
jgi:hypothetical protein